MTIRVNLIHYKLIFFKKIQKLNTLKKKKKKVHATVQVNCTVHVNSAIHLHCARKHKILQSSS